MSRTHAFLLLAAGCLAGCAGRADRIATGPYGNRVDASSARVLWVSRPGVPAQPVRLEGGGLVLEGVSVTAPIAGRPELLHTAAFEGLRSATRYRYRIGADGGAAAGSFVTAPEAGAPSPVRFAVYGDTRTYPDRHRAVAEGIAREEPAFVLCSGDLVADGEVWERWEEEFFGPAAPYLSRSVLWPVRGNHEGDGVFYRELFDLPGNELYYSFEYGNAHFVVLDCYSERAEMLEWLERDLAASRAQWTFVVLHVPIFNVGGHTSRWGREDFLPVLERHGVDFVIAGHSHLYERFLPIGPPGGKPLIHVVSGRGGAPPYPAVPSPALAGGIGNSDLHYCLFELDGNRCEMTVKRPDGSVMDSLLLVKEGDSYQDAVMAQAVDTQTAAALTPLFVSLQVDFPALPQPGQTTRATLRGSGLAMARHLAVEQADEPRGWRVVPREGAPEDGEFAFEVTPPDGLTVSLSGLDPPLRVTLTATVATGTFQGRDVGLGLAPAMARLTVPEPEPVDVPRAPGEIAVDGDLAEWADVPSLPRPFQGAESSCLRLCWRPEGLYGAATVRDDSIRAEPEAPWQADALELFIDKDFSRATERTAQSAQYAFSPAPAAGPGAGHWLVAYGGYGEAQADVRCAWSPVEGGYVLEFLLPARVLAPAAMEAGTVMGLNFALSNDGVPVEQFYSDKNRDRGWGTPIRWGAVRLAE